MRDDRKGSQRAISSVRVLIKQLRCCRNRGRRLLAVRSAGTRADEDAARGQLPRRSGYNTKALPAEIGDNPKLILGAAEPDPVSPLSVAGTKCSFDLRSLELRTPEPSAIIAGNASRSPCPLTPARPSSVRTLLHSKTVESSFSRSLTADAIQ